MSFETLIALAGVAAAAFWLMSGINRLTLAWQAVQNRVKELDQKRIDMARGLMTVGQELLLLKRDEKDANERLATLRGQVAAKTKELAEFVPPPPQEILISSEYPSTRDDKAWIAHLVRGQTQQQYLIWAGDHSAALNRARTVLSDMASGYEIANVQRFG